MQLQDYIHIIRKRWWIIGLVALSAAVAAYVISLFQTPLFRVHSEWNARINRIDSGAALGGANFVMASYRNSVFNPDKLQAISDQLGLDRSGSAMMEYVTVQSQPNDMKFVIEVEYYTVGEAQRIASAVGDALNAEVVEANRTAEGQDRLILKPTLSPQFVSYSPNKRINTLAGAILGLIVGLLLAFVLEYMDDTLKSAADVERFANLVTIGSIPSGAAQSSRVRPRFRAAPSSGIVASIRRSEND